MKDKIRAILNAELTLDGKVDLLDAMQMSNCFSYKVWACKRDLLILESGGLQGFSDDTDLPPTEIWERFINDLNNKE